MLESEQFIRHNAEPPSPRPLLLYELSSMIRSMILGLMCLLLPAVLRSDEAHVDSKDWHSPLAPEESLSAFQVHPDFEISLVACEPQTVDPVAMRFDDRGRIWVVEMSDYPEGVGPTQKPLGRVRILEDQDHDGYYEAATTFADGLLFATGLELFRDGVLVTVGSRLVYLKDTDGDDRCDFQEEWLDGFAIDNPQLRANNPTLGMDLQLYVANGLRSSYVSWSRSLKREEHEEKVSIQNRDLRMNVVSKELVAITGPSQFGMTWDRYGRRYFCSNRNPCDAVCIEQNVAPLSPLTGLVPLTRSVVPAGEASRVKPLTKAWTTSNLHAGQFSAACSVLLSDAGVPVDTLAYAYTCEPTGNLVHRETLRWKEGAAYVADTMQEQEWLASHDAWFRPVYLTEGPDEAIYVVDMYRAVIEHPEWVPDELKKRPDARFGDDRGRIYRVSKKASDSQRNQVFAGLQTQPLSQRGAGDLVTLLGSSSYWMRSTASRLLLETYLELGHYPSDIVEQLKSTARAELPMDGRLRAMYHLLLVSKLESSDIDVILASNDNAAVAAVYRLLQRAISDTRVNSSLSNSLNAWIDKGIEAADAEVLREAAWLAALRRDNRTIETTERLAIRAARVIEDPYAITAITAAAYPHWQEFLIRLTKELSNRPEGSSTWNFEVVRQLTTAILRDSKQDPHLISAELLSAWRKEDDAVNNASHWSSLCASTLAVYECGRGEMLSSVQHFVLKQATKVALDQSKESSGRENAIELLGYLPHEDTQSVLLPLLEDDSWEIKEAAWSAWARRNDSSVSNRLVDELARALPKERELYFQLILKSDSRIEVFLDRVEAGLISLKVLDASQLQALRSVVNTELLDRCNRLIENSVDRNRAAVIEHYRIA